MYWADRLIQQLDKSKKHRVDDMKTPSGHAHVGSLRAIGTHALVYEAMKHAGFDVDFTYMVNDLDPMDGMPVYLDKNEYDVHMGKPLYAVPAPDGVSESMAEQYAFEYIYAFQELGFKPEIYWSSKLYKEGKFNDCIRKVLDSVEKVRDIYREVANQEKPEGWYPLQVICPQCGKVGSSLVTDWDGEMVTYTCTPDLVSWAVGCGHSGKISPFDGNAKLMWKADWPAHWAVMGITVEGAGKDHMTSGGSHAIASEIARNIFGNEPPFAFLHEFFVIGGAKMSSSKGNAMKAADLVKIVPKDLARFLLVRTPYQRAIDFNPNISDTIPDLFDDYDDCAKAWFSSRDETPQGRMFQASALNVETLKEVAYYPRFRDVARVLQFPSVDIFDHFASLKGSEYTEFEKAILYERIHFARIWLDVYADEKEVFTFKEEIPEITAQLSDLQRDFLLHLADMLEKSEIQSGDALHADVFELVKAHKVQNADAFKAIYVALYGKNHGPKAGWVLYELITKDKNTLVHRLREVGKGVHPEHMHTKSDFSDNFIHGGKELRIDEDMKSKWPSVSIGCAVLENIHIEEMSEELEKMKEDLVVSLDEMTNETLSTDPNVLSYRKMYKEFSIDWHSRRPSPEALMRRIVQKKPLYTINTCVDAGNVVVLKNMVSIGLFDADHVEFPIRVGLAKGDEKIHLLGDDEETIIKDGEVCYFDQKGVYNLDFNYRDSQRTKVTTATKNLVINVDGVHDVTKEKVAEILDETIAMIQKFCGGTVVHKEVIY